MMSFVIYFLTFVSGFECVSTYTSITGQQMRNIESVGEWREGCCGDSSK